MTAEINTFDEEFVPPRRVWLLLALFGIGLALWCTLSLLLPHDRYIRYQQFTDSDLFRTRWVYERIHYDKTPIDVAIIGSSRLEAAISAPLLEKQLSEKFGRPIHVANLAIPQEGRNLHYLVARELVENRPETRIILVSVGEQADLSHPAFRYLADVDELLREPILINHYYFLDTAFLPYRQMSYFVQSKFPEWFGVSHSFRQDYQGTGFDTTYSFYLPSGKLVNRYSVMPPDKLAADSAKIIKDQGGSWHQPSHWDALNNPLENEYTKRLADAAKGRCVEVLFVHLPFYNTPTNMYDKGFYQGLAPVLDAKPLSKDPHSYQDVLHFNRYGTERVSQWLKSSIDPYLGPLDNRVSCPR